MDPPANTVRGDALLFDSRSSLCFQLIEPFSSKPEAVQIQICFDRALAKETQIGRTNPVGGKQSGQRMDQYLAYRQRISDGAGMLPSSPTKADQRVIAEVVTASD